MTENKAKAVLKVVLADQKKVNAFLKKMFAYVPKDSTALEADHLAKKLDKLSMAGLLRGGSKAIFFGVPDLSFGHHS